MNFGRWILDSSQILLLAGSNFSPDMFLLNFVDALQQSLFHFVEKRSMTHFPVEQLLKGKGNLKPLEYMKTFKSPQADE